MTETTNTTSTVYITTHFDYNGYQPTPMSYTIPLSMLQTENDVVKLKSDIENLKYEILELKKHLINIEHRLMHQFLRGY